MDHHLEAQLKLNTCYDCEMECSSIDHVDCECRSSVVIGWVTYSNYESDWLPVCYTHGVDYDRIGYH